MRFALATFFLAACLSAVETPILPDWGSEPVESSGTARATICLNGIWLFRPVGRDGAAAWGELRVPGAWAAKNHPMPGLERAGAGAGWEGLGTNNRDPAWQHIALGHYARRLAIPADWNGRRILLELQRVGTDARVFLDGVPVGAVGSPAGILDLTAAAQPGTSPLLEVEVQAAASTDEVTVFMGTAADQVFKKKADLRCRGLLGDVLLRSEPAGARCEDVFVRSSVRQGRVDLDLELSGVPDGTLQASARMLGPDGVPERTFAGEATVVGGRATVGWVWPDARRWDLGQPELYTLDLALRAPGFDDRVQVEFGFKELWIDGRRLMLNGTEFHPRPYALVNEQDRDWGQAELIDGCIAGLRAAGFDCQELWPWDQSERGVPDFHALWYERAKRAGWGIFAPLQDTRQILGGAWKDPVKRGAWEAAVRAQMKRDRNNPAILMWVHTPNVYGVWNDQDPRLLGMQSKLGVHYMAQGLEANAFVRSLDPTRPVTTHHGGAVGDVHTANTYPCLAQPQEQAEWLSHWAQHGEVPFWAIEFGPFVLDYRRGRLTGGWGQPFGAIHTELQATEQLAAWYGREAYAAEPAMQRTLNPRYFDADQRYNRVPDSWFGANPLADRHMAEQLLGVFRAWRSMGAAFSPLPWEAQHGWDRSCNAQGENITQRSVPSPPFVAGRRGLWFRELPVNALRFLQPDGARALSRPAALVASNGPALMWICAPPHDGDPGAIAARDHAVVSGGSLDKAVALLNDTRVEAAWSVRWQVLAGTRELASGTADGRMQTGTRTFVPIRATMPVVDGPLDAEIVCTATLGGHDLTDRFAIRIHPAPRPVGWLVQSIDPEGASARLLARLGVSSDAGAPVRVIGRNALARGGVHLADHQAWVRAGGRLLVMAQDPEWLRTTVGWRVGYQVLRRVFPLDPAHPVMQGLDELDLRDWSGAGTLVEAYPELSEAERGAARYPVHLWHWGNRGSVCSAPIEKPHRSAWRPLLECDFDLAWTPLMELDWGKGRVTWCQLDLEDRDDPAAVRLAANLLRHVALAPLTETPGSVRFAGDAAERAFLDRLGLEIGDHGPLVLGHGADPALAAGGGRIIALDAAPLGLVSTHTAAWAGGRDVPTWPQLAGLSSSDLRRSVDGPQELLPEIVGWERAADGLLARRGDVLLCLADPRVLPADTKTYYRFARWHLTRTLCQVLADAGAGFAADRRIWGRPGDVADADEIDLAGDWAARLTVPLLAATDPAAKHPESKPSDAARAALDPAFDDATWECHRLPGDWASWGGDWAALDGEAVFRRTIELPATFAGRPGALLELGPIDDVDRAYVNGTEIGHTGTDQPEFWKRQRSYRIPDGVLRPGRNTVVIVAQDLFGGGMVGDGAQPFRLRVPSPPPRDGWYHPDVELRHEVADDPHRYYRW
jgi:beta-galactosidase